MERDPVADAFTRWKTAHDLFLEAEMQLFAATQARAYAIGAQSPELDALYQDVQSKRAQADGLLMAAMRLLHERRHGHEGSGDRPGQAPGI